MVGSCSQSLRLALATNIVVAALLWNGPPRRLLDAAIGGEVGFRGSAVLLDELPSTLDCSKFDKRIDAFGMSIAALAAPCSGLVSLVVPPSVPRVVANDADEDHVIAVAVAARAELIATGDRKHLLPFGTHQGVAIITAREVLDRLEARLKS